MACVLAVRELDEVPWLGRRERGGQLIRGGYRYCPQWRWGGWYFSQHGGWYHRGRRGGRGRGGRCRSIPGGCEGGRHLDGVAVGADPGGQRVFSGRNAIEVERERCVPVVEQRVAVERELDPFDLVESVRARVQSHIHTGRHGLPVQRVRVGDKHPAVMSAGRGAQACGRGVPGCAGDRCR